MNRRIGLAVSILGLVLAGATGCGAKSHPSAASSRKPTPTAGASHQAPTARGTVTAITAASITIRESSGATQQFTLGRKTRVRQNGAAASVADLSVGEKVAVFVDGTGSTARRIVIRSGGGSSSPGAGTPTPSPTA